MKGLIYPLLIILLSSCASSFKSIDEVVDHTGHQLATIQKAKPFSFIPVVGYISSHFGYRNDPNTKERKLHKGLDIRTDVGESVISPFGGQVIFAGTRAGFGKIVEILHDNQITTRFAHLDKILVKQPQRVEQGQLLGLSGQTGNATGPHLHYEILINGKPIDPFLYTQTRTIRYANGKEM